MASPPFGQLGADYGIDRWDDLVVLPEFVDQIPPAAVEQIARLLDRCADG